MDKVCESIFPAQPKTQPLCTFGAGLLGGLGGGSIHFPASYSAGEIMAPFSHTLGDELRQILGGHETIIGAPPRVCFRCQMRCSFLELG